MSSDQSDGKRINVKRDFIDTPETTGCKSNNPHQKCKYLRRLYAQIYYFQHQPPFVQKIPNIGKTFTTFPL